MGDAHRSNFKRTVFVCSRVIPNRSFNFICFNFSRRQAECSPFSDIGFGRGGERVVSSRDALRQARVGLDGLTAAE